jgi:beta-galactosidase/beta-glucuronidase
MRFDQENRKIRRVLQGEKPAQSKIGRAVVPDEMSNIFEVVRKEAVGALQVQRWWRRALCRRKWRLKVYQAMQVPKIQAAARGMIARRMVAVW